MSCKYLAEGKVCRCLASELLMVPSLFEMAVFCRANHTDCLIYQEKERSGYASVDPRVPAPQPVFHKPNKSFIA